MQVLVHSDSQRALDCFRKVRHGGGFEILLHPSRDYRKSLRDQQRPVVVYLDIQNFTQAEVTRALNYLSSADGVLVGVIDPKEDVGDIAGLFHQGLFDYIGKSLWREGVTLKRFRKAIDACSARITTDESGRINEVRLIPADGWDRVAEGGEYTFCFMFFELDLNEDWKTKSGPEHLDRVISSLKNHLHRTVSAIDGKIWMWAEYGGLTLLPFDGKSCEAVLASFRMMLNRTIISAEDFEFDTLLSYRIALHIGNTVYRPRGRTGTIISDSVNFIFHLGHQFAQPGGFYLSSSVYPFIPKGLESSFIDCGMFEDNRIYRMRRLIT